MFELRIDDVLLVGELTSPMKRAKEIQSFFEWFKETDKMFEDAEVPCVLAILADGIDVYPEWVEYIKQRKHRYRIEMHGWNHFNYASVPKEEAVKLLKKAKKKIEKAFDVKVKRWYAPFNEKGFPPWYNELEGLVGVKFHTKGNPVRHLYFHYWDRKNIESLRVYIKALKKCLQMSGNN